MIEPSNRNLLVAVADALRTRIMPICAADAWASSELRSIDTVLAIVTARLEHEDDVVAEDNAELRPLLAGLRAAGVPVPTLMDEHDPRAANLEMRTALEATLQVLHDGTHPDELASVRRYLVDATRREQRLYGPLTGRRLF